MLTVFKKCIVPFLIALMVMLSGFWQQGQSNFFATNQEDLVIQEIVDRTELSILSQFKHRKSSRCLSERQIFFERVAAWQWKYRSDFAFYRQPLVAKIGLSIWNRGPPAQFG